MQFVDFSNCCFYVICVEVELRLIFVFQTCGSYCMSSDSSGYSHAAIWHFLTSRNGSLIRKFKSDLISLQPHPQLAHQNEQFIGSKHTTIPTRSSPSHTRLHRRTHNQPQPIPHHPTPTPRIHIRPRMGQPSPNQPSQRPPTRKNPQPPPCRRRPPSHLPIQTRVPGQ